MKTSKLSRLTDLITLQDHYYLLTDGTKYARHGSEEANGLLVFANLDRAEQFCLTIVARTNLPFVPVKVSGPDFLEHALAAGAICVVDGLTARVGRIEP